MIYALSSGGGGKTAVAVIRMSGDDSVTALQKMLKGQSVPEARVARVRNLYDPRSGEGEDLLDKALVLVFPAPDSFTGEDMVELHVHGGGAVVRSVLAALSSIEGSRHAVAGEFSRLAFSNGKMDFTAAEGLADLINAETDAQRRLAVRQVEGEAYHLLENWSQRLMKILAYIEACLDFPDEELPPGLPIEIVKDMEALVQEMRYQLSLSEGAERLRHGVRVAIVGSANVGKSSLLNYFAARSAAIVSEVAGTTRDVIEVFLEWDGIPVILTDTAGLRESADVVEGEGVRRALRVIEEADMRLWVYDLTDLPARERIGEEMKEGDLLVFNKSDLVSDIPEGIEGEGYIISVKEGLGLEDGKGGEGEGGEGLRAGVLARLGDLLSVIDAAVIVRARHAAMVREVVDCLGKNMGEGGGGFELLAEDLRNCLALLGRVTGRVSSEDLLDIIFADFCIGK